jgi:hypothetical protein
MRMKKPGRSITSARPGDVSFDCGSNVAELKAEAATPQATLPIDQIVVGQRHHRDMGDLDGLAAIAELVVASSSVTASNDALFPHCPGQTWTWWQAAK